MRSGDCQKSLICYWILYQLQVTNLYRNILFPKFLKDSSTNSQQGDLRFSGPPSCQDAGGGARIRDERILADNQGGLASHCATDAP
ncbi:hypothetical protein PoB_003784600 [Plakobranchus ocellatus]|uniref:Uncharacterized protein n=1 Tax=Plakobranchus ocellatus TaxID=259542 RepID=A0AAV4AXT9_9GAST|nr:hypothetical protein PoB_003784600 [Plakobranchus ocellatus]